MELTERKWNLTDTHCHQYSHQFDGDRKEMMERSVETGVTKFYLPAIDSTTHEAMLQMETGYPQCIAMMGVHPCSITADYKKELAIAEEWLGKRDFVAIGEIGLDYYWSTEFVEQQQEAFITQMQWALDKNLPIVIHTRNAMQPTIEMVKPFADKGLRGIFHCFGGTAADAEAITDTGFYLGIGGVLTYKKSGLPEALANIPLDKMVLETDAPYLSPVPHRGKRNESSYLPFIAQKLAEIKNVSVEEVAQITTENAEKIFTASV
ncbi:MAG: TatD family hydrolase [Williamsia sp.]|nr:TatD family hydrolase [Williamsia sp.]